MFLPTILLAAVPVTDPPAPLSLAQEPEAGQEPAWHGSFSLGFLTATGNTERTSANFLADGELRREKDRTTLGAFWSYATEEDDLGNSTTTERRLGGNAKYDRFLDERSYLLATGSAEKDAKADLDLRWTAGLGYGYQVREEEDYKLSTEVGLSYFNEDFKGAPVDDYISARAAYDVFWKPAEDWTLEQTGQIFPSVENSDDVYSKLDTRGRYNFSEAMFAQAQWVWDWDNTPAAGNERSDHRLLLSVGWSF